MTTHLIIVIPVYNEELIIAKVLQDWSYELDSLGINFEIRAYNDGSKDNTLAMLNDFKNKVPGLVVIDKKNSGHGPTILQGYRDACKESEWIFQVDSDNEMPATYFRKLWENKVNYDFLIGKRQNREQHLSRKIISIFSRLTVWSFYGRGVADVNSPYRLMRTSCFSELFNKIPDDTFAPNLIISGYAAQKRLRIFQMDVPHTNRKTGEVSIKHLKLLRIAIKSYWQSIAFSFKRR